MNEKSYYVGFSVFPGVGPQKFSSLLTHFPSAKTAWEAAPDELQKVIGEKLTAKFVIFRTTFDLEGYQDQLERKEVLCITLAEEEYPELLKQIKNPPFVLYIKGEKKILKPIQNDNLMKYIAVVGTRRITSYGKTVTQLFTEQLVHDECIIVSGLALGVDAIAHKTALANNGTTIAVLGNGVDLCFPKENQKIYDEILSHNGAIVSEYPLSLEPTIGSFPARNRIIAGLSNAVLVTEGSEDSGALITADHAFDFGRKVFAIPGPITSSLSKGPHTLLKRGGVLVVTPEDMLNELGVAKIQSVNVSKKAIGDTPDEQKILDLLIIEPMMIDQLIKRSGLSSSQIGIVLSLLELKGIIIAQNSYYSLARL